MPRRFITCTTFDFPSAKTGTDISTLTRPPLSLFQDIPNVNGLALPDAPLRSEHLTSLMST
jgi:hypothetical protein